MSKGITKEQLARAKDSVIFEVQSLINHVTRRIVDHTALYSQYPNGYKVINDTKAYKKMLQKLLKMAHKL